MSAYNATVTVTDDTTAPSKTITPPGALVETNTSERRDGGLGGLGSGAATVDSSLGQMILNRVVELQAQTKEDMTEDLRSFLGGKGLPSTGGTVLPRGGGIQISGATLPATAGGTKYGGDIINSVRLYRQNDPTYRPYDDEQ